LNYEQHKRHEDGEIGRGAKRAGVTRGYGIRNTGKGSTALSTDPAEKALENTS
jgi:hypothetical protein